MKASGPRHSVREDQGCDEPPRVLELQRGQPGRNRRHQADLPVGPQESAGQAEERNL